MARMRVIGASLDKGYRDDLNYNFGLLEALIGEANGLTDTLRQEMLNYINNLQQQINILTGENIDELLARLNDSIQQALTAAQEARTSKTATEEATALATVSTELANASAAVAEEKANYANEKAVLAQEAADNANIEASNLSQLKIDVVQATQNAKEEANKANEKATLANNVADRANLAADNADEATSRANFEGWGTVEQWVNNKLYVRNNVVTDNGSTWQALRTNSSITPVEGDDWICLARKGLDGTGAVSSVNNRYPGTDGNVEVNWADIPEKPLTFPSSTHTHEINDVIELQESLDSKANEVDLNNLERVVTENQQIVTEHLAENTWHQVTLLNGWEPFGVGYDPKYTIDKHNNLILKGAIKNGVTAKGTMIFELPVNARPAVYRMFSVVNNNQEFFNYQYQASELSIDPKGGVSISSKILYPQYLSMDEIRIQL
ncbi:hypothetical protein [Lysinibacillus fusiformis]|uniref:hypothetical protein n=1 Tax=Lysinibacillus fusiformis TaxID=28031 RepID=UPI0018819316|nr:hypothetical protein [Lysinibacillus fusiformis]MBD8522339.1 hypothetical protein [Lysinibacillus fusiformis]